jgi:hypothetical protein
MIVWNEEKKRLRVYINNMLMWDVTRAKNFDEAIKIVTDEAFCSCYEETWNEMKKNVVSHDDLNMCPYCGERTSVDFIEFTNSKNIYKAFLLGGNIEADYDDEITGDANSDVEEYDYVCHKCKHDLNLEEACQMLRGTSYDRTDKQHS